MGLTTIVHVAQDSAYGLLIAFVALAVWAFYTGRIHSDREFSKLEQRCELLETALSTERQINTELTRAGSVTNQLIGALTEVASERNSAGRVREEASGLTAKDLGL